MSFCQKAKPDIFVMRRKGIYRREWQPDAKYGSLLVARLINKLMRNGKKAVAERIVYTALRLAAAETKLGELETLEAAVKNVSPSVQLRSRRIGGANYQIPVEVTPERKIVLALRWLVEAARGRKGKPMAERLASELIDAVNSAGGAFKKKEETHRMAEANRAFAHFGRF